MFGLLLVSLIRVKKSLRVLVTVILGDPCSQAWVQKQF